MQTRIFADQTSQRLICINQRLHSQDDLPDCKKLFFFAQLQEQIGLHLYPVTLTATSYLEKLRHEKTDNIRH